MTGIDDDEVRWRMRAADPARALAPLTPDELSAHIAAAVGEPAPRHTPTRRSRWMIAGVGALSAGAAASLLLPLAFGVGGGAASTLELPSTGGPMAMCAPVDAAALEPAEIAFRAEVTGIDQGVVTLSVTDRFAGEVADTVQVTQSPESAVDGAPITFEPGVGYLVAASGGVILTCGLSGPDSAALGDLYREAFALR
ncbi:hypothetical protein GRS96_06455 [Rathayibacter sp. VKM Ac-2803]|uniref:hypothetical protein n=1 Tax=unclassified Rathayibacter TaxID=2609250 RepID=UPI00135BE08E|nr:MULTISPECIES: hypothetical protein [unclassified Rathayibacter]MWV48918.1 hypothetical protein [Rathayibacter sp. VKM Ac-2803]MWV58589.1 hypothetical protein [Rathayibacter sp. VKM Ac-2754]